MNHTPTILVVDDDDMARDVITRLLRRALPDMTVISANDGDSGWDQFSKLRPSLLITDMKMGRMTGSELIAKVRGSDATIPIIVITGAPENRAVAGATEVILKVNFEALIGRVKALLNIPAAAKAAT